jgi:hypothetical protein
MPFGPPDRDAGYWRECSMRQVEISRTIVFDEPCRARSFFYPDDKGVVVNVFYKHSRVKQYLNYLQPQLACL